MPYPASARDPEAPPNLRNLHSFTIFQFAAYHNQNSVWFSCLLHPARMFTHAFSFFPPFTCITGISKCADFDLVTAPSDKFLGTFQMTTLKLGNLHIAL